MATLCAGQTAQTGGTFLSLLRNSTPTITLAPTTFALNPISWTSDSVLVGAKSPIIINGHGAVIDITDLSGSVLADGTSAVSVVNGSSVTVNDTSLFSDVPLSQLADLDDYLAWLQVSNGSVVYSGVTIFANAQSDVEALAKELRAAGAVVINSPPNAVVFSLMYTPSYYSTALPPPIAFQTCTVQTMFSATTHNISELQVALNDPTVQYINVTHDVTTQSTITVSRPLLIVAFTPVIWQLGAQNETLAVASNGTLKIQGAFTLRWGKTVAPPSPESGTIRIMSIVTSTNLASQTSASCTLGPVRAPQTASTTVVTSWVVDLEDPSSCSVPDSNAYLYAVNVTILTENGGNHAPIVAIVFPTLFALALCALGILACVLYKRRRTSPEAQTPGPYARIQEIANKLLSKQTSIDGIIGGGSYARVYRGVWDGRDVAIKIAFPQPIDSENASRQNEALLGMRLKHPNLVATLHTAHRKVKSQQGLTKIPSTATSLLPTASPLNEVDMRQQQNGQLRENWFVLELCDLGSLKDCVQSNRFDRTSWTHVLFTLRDIVRGLRYMHDHDALHGDLNTNNVMLCSDASSPTGFVAKIADFGMSRIIAAWRQRTKSTLSHGTVTHQPPELLRDGHLGPKADIYAFGIIMYELYATGNIYKDQRTAQIIKRVSHDGMRPRFSHDAPANYTTLAHRCWATDPSDRPDPVDIVQQVDALIREFCSRGSTRSAAG